MRFPNLPQALEMGLIATGRKMKDIFTINTKGVYRIYNKVNGKFYIGSSLNVPNRITVHFSLLRNNRHYNKKLQNAWNKYGEENFDYEVLRMVKDISEINQYEQTYIDKLKPEYNILPKAYTTLGYKMTEEQRINNQKRIQQEWDSGKRVASDKNRQAAQLVGIGNTGRKHGKYSKERVAKTSGNNSPVAKLTESDVMYIKALLDSGDFTHKEIAKRYNVSRTCITSINNNKTWVGAGW